MQKKELKKIEKQKEKKGNLKGDSSNQEGDNWVNDYKKAFFGGFQRIRANKALWFWGLFLPISLSFGLDLNKNSLEEFGKIDGKVFFEWNIFNANLFFIFLLLILFFWWLSALVRVGVIREIDKLQNVKKTIKIEYNSVWKSRDKKIAKKILELDLIFLGFNLFTIFCLFFPAVWSFFRGNQQVSSSIFFFASIFYLLISVGFSVIKNTSINLTIFSKNKLWNNLEIAGFLLKLKIKEAIRFILTLFIFDFFIKLFFLSLGFLFFTIWFIFIGDAEMPTSIEDTTQLLVVIYSNDKLFSSFFISTFVFLITVLFFRAIFALWFYDLWLWWLKRVGALWVMKPIKSEEELKVELVNHVASYKESIKIRKK